MQQYCFEAELNDLVNVGWAICRLAPSAFAKALASQEPSLVGPNCDLSPHHLLPNIIKVVHVFLLCRAGLGSNLRKGYPC